MPTFTDIALDTNGDVAVSASGLSIAAGRRAVAQRILQRFMIFRGEWFIDRSKGVPYRNDILVKNPNLTVVDVLMRQVILETPSVVGLQRFSVQLDRDRREYRVSFLAETTEGEVAIEGAIGAGTIAPEFIILMG